MFICASRFRRSTGPTISDFRRDISAGRSYPSRAGLDIRHYRFDWQIIYYEEHPLHVPKGTRMEITAHWDNSANNPDNPDPRADVHLGPQNSGEMLVCHTGLTVERHASLTNLVTVENSTR
jgi:hypothetical protein